jgi:hypothetical protein
LKRDGWAILLSTLGQKAKRPVRSKRHKLRRSI